MSRWARPYPLTPFLHRPRSPIRQRSVPETLRVRIAPSPTGALHLGLARTALFNWAYARGRGGDFILRIEDSDLARSTKESEAAILEGLAWLGIEWDEGPDKGGPHAPYYQSQRAPRHRELAGELLAAGHAYRCFCTPERLDALRAEQQARKETPAYDGRCRELDRAVAAERDAAGEPNVVRFRVPSGETRFVDLVRGEVAFHNREVDDWIMLRGGGLPTYNFAVVCDDADMRITHVLRGEEHLVNTPKQILLYRALGLEPPHFAHLPLLLGKDKRKLSKRSGDTSLDDYRARGYPRDAIVNFLCLQGWALDGKTEVFSREDLVRSFDVRDVSKGGSIFDLDKFVWLAGEYLRKEPTPELAEHCAPFVVAARLMTAGEIAARRAWFEALVEAERERLHLYADLPARIAFYFAPDDALQFDEQAEQGARKHEGRVATLRAYHEWLAAEATFEAAELARRTKEWAAGRGLKLPQLFQPLRCALTGLPGGPDLFETMVRLGRERSLRRIARGAERLA